MQKISLTLTPDEHVVLLELSRHHEKAYIRRRGLALLALAEGQEILAIAGVLRITDQSVRNWVKDWEAQGIAGLLKRRKGGAPAKLTVDLIELAVQIAESEPMSLAQLSASVRKLRPEAPHFSLDRLAARLKERGQSYKRTRLSLKKTGSGAV